MRTGLQTLGGNSRTGPEWRVGPKGSRFQKIKGRKCRSFFHTCANLFCAIEKQQNSDRAECFPSDQNLPSLPFCVRVSASIISGRAMAPPQRRMQVSLRIVMPSIPEGGVEHAQLEEDLRGMRYTGLLERPWGLKQEEIVREL